MSQAYKKSCTNCKQTIEMSDRKEGKWLPWNLDGTIHECNQTGTRNVQQINKKVIADVKEEMGVKGQEPTPEAKAWIREIMEGPKLKELDDRLKRLEAMLLGDRR